MADPGEKTPLLSGLIINIPVEKNEKKKLKCLTYEEIIVYEADPFWVSFRQIFFYSFWVVIVSLVISAGIIARSQIDKCKATNTTTSSPTPPVELLSIVSSLGSQLRPTNMSLLIDNFILRSSIGSDNVTSS